MAILDWENYGEETNSNYAGWWTTPRTLTISSDGQGPYGIGRYATVVSFTYDRRNWFANTAEGWFNSHVWVTSAASASDFHYALDSGTTQVYCRVNTNLQIEVRRGDNTLLGTSTRQLAVGAWYFIQSRYLIANAGSFEVWVNGEQWLTGSGDTQNSANAYFNGWAPGIGSLRVTNHVVHSVSGNAPTSRTPETIVYSDVPNGAGAATGWTPSAGSNWQNVDDVPADNDTTYNSTTGLNDDLYAFPSGTVPSSAIVYAVCAEADVRKDDAGANSIDLLCRGGGTTAAYGTPLSLSTSYLRTRAMWDLDPSTAAAWSVANANGSQVGIRRTV